MATIPRGEAAQARTREQLVRVAMRYGKSQATAEQWADARLRAREARARGFREGVSLKQKKALAREYRAKAFS